MLCSVAVLFHKVRAGQMDRLDRYLDGRRVLGPALDWAGTCFEWLHVGWDRVVLRGLGRGEGICEVVESVLNCSSG